jgi:proteic killer suppression protein
MIRGFADAVTEQFWRTGKHRRLPATLRNMAMRKLQYLDHAASLADLSVPPGNRLEKLRGNREGQYSIRINDQFRICFAWRIGDAFEVEITDYH